MFGVGGGFLLTPILIGWFDVPAPIAVGSALSQKCGTSIASFLKYRQLKRGEPRFDYVMMGGSLIGVDAGTRLLAALDRAGTMAPATPLIAVHADRVHVFLFRGRDHAQAEAFGRQTSARTVIRHGARPAISR